MQDEWNLSDKMHIGVPVGEFDIEDVKEFIRRLKEASRDNKIDFEMDFEQIIDKLAGDKLC